MVAYPTEWGKNVASAENGGKVLSVSSESGDEIGEKLIDGKNDEGHHWEPAWERGRPYYFVVQLATEVSVGVIHFSTYSDMNGGKGGVPRTVEIWSSTTTEEDLKQSYKTELKNENEQTIRIEDVFPAKILKIVVLSDYGSKGGALGEVAVFGSVSALPSAFRGTWEHDILELKNGDVLTGTIEDQQLDIQTSYAKATFKKSELASIIFEGDTANVEKLVLANGDVISGFIFNKSFNFILKTGPQVELRREKIKRVGLRIWADESQGKTPSVQNPSPQHDFFQLKNGDTFNGEVKTPKLTILTSYATIPIEIKDIASIEFIGENRVVTKITLWNDNQLQGLLQEDDIVVDLDCGPEIMVYKDRIDKILFQEPESLLKNES
jgi:hypothetical protein